MAIENNTYNKIILKRNILNAMPLEVVNTIDELVNCTEGIKSEILREAKRRMA